MKSVMTCNIALYAIKLSLDTTEFSWICCLLFYYVALVFGTEERSGWGDVSLGWLENINEIWNSP
jgi:hypothetical protein